MKVPRRLILGAAVLAAIGVLGPRRAGAEQYAVLIGVSEYPSLRASLQLKGPRNDVAAMEQLLETRGVPAANIVKLGDGIADAALPTRANILSALDRTIAQARPGDRAILYFAGHGSQQPQAKQAADEEPDGLDEIFLPRDVGRWDGSMGSVANAIIDDEIGAVIDRLRSKGATVWAIFDTCHAGSMTRNERMPMHVRSVSAQELGVPLGRISTLSKQHRLLPSRASPKQTAQSGDLVAYYAAGSDELTSEEMLPRDGLAKSYRGIFSFQLESALHRSGEISYQQALQDIVAAYHAQGRLMPTPRMESSAHSPHSASGKPVFQ